MFGKNEDEKEFEKLLTISRVKYTQNNLTLDKWVDFTYPKWINYNKEYDALKRIITDNSNILDIGAGPGYTMWFLRKYKNCKIHGCDIKKHNYTIIRDVFDIEKDITYINPIKSLTPTILPKNDLDFILALKIQFDGKEGWDENQWSFFIEDMSKYLKVGGLLLINPNRMEMFRNLFKNLNLTTMKHYNTINNVIYIFQRTI